MSLLKPYQPHALPDVLRFIGECLHRDELCGPHPGDLVHWMSNSYRGRDLDQNFALATDTDGRLLAVADTPTAKKSAFELIVHPAHRGGMFERQLIAECETLWRERNPDSPAISTSVLGNNSAYEGLLVERGYQKQLPINLVLTVRALNVPLPMYPLPDSFSIRSAEPHEAAVLAEVHNNAFKPKWTEAEYDAAMGTPGYDANRELVVVAPDRTMAAFLIYWLDPISRSGLFEPVGTHRSYQRLGLGKALMAEGLRRMRQAGMEHAIVSHLLDNPSAAALYASMGFIQRCILTEFRRAM